MVEYTYDVLSNTGLLALFNNGNLTEAFLTLVIFLGSIGFTLLVITLEEPNRKILTASKAMLTIAALTLVPLVLSTVVITKSEQHTVQVEQVSKTELTVSNVAGAPVALLPGERVAKILTSNTVNEGKQVLSYACISDDCAAYDELSTTKEEAVLYLLAKDGSPTKHYRIGTVTQTS